MQSVVEQDRIARFRWLLYALFFIFFGLHWLFAPRASDENFRKLRNGMSAGECWWMLHWSNGKLGSNETKLLFGTYAVEAKLWKGDYTVIAIAFDEQGKTCGKTLWYEQTPTFLERIKSSLGLPW